MAGTAVKDKFEIAPPDNGGFEISAPTGPDISSEASMAAHPPAAPKPAAMKPSYAGLAVSNSPTGADPHNPGNPNLSAIPQSEREAVSNRAFGTQFASIGGGPIAKAAVMRSVKPLIPVAKSMVGMIGGKYLGREVGGIVGHPGAGETLGSIAGGLYGGMGGEIPTSKEAVARMLSAEPEAELAPLGSPENPGWHSKIPTRMPKPIVSAPELGSPENPGFHSKIPTRMPPKVEPVTAPPELGSPENPGFHSKLPTRMPEKLTPIASEPELGSPGNPGWHSKIPNRMPRTPGSPEPPAAEGPGLPKAQVVKLPVPREPLPTDNPGYMASIPRSRLMDLGRQGRPGAGQQLQNIGKTPLYIPEGGYAPPKSVESLQHIGRSTEPTAENYLRSIGGHEAPEVELMHEPSGPRANASGAPGGGGLEEIGRQRAEASQGVKYFRENPGGGRAPLEGQGRQDLKAGYGQKIIRVNADGTETVLDEKSLHPGATRVRKLQ